jgi:hypothetical protein
MDRTLLHNNRYIDHPANKDKRRNYKYLLDIMHTSNNELPATAAVHRVASHVFYVQEIDYVYYIRCPRRAMNASNLSRLCSNMEI